ncbi:MAG: hypothetical protein D3907_13775, partial [Candidatus Electrothrix sp. AUS3]|nr:hypothetical protein [Candidatus Electrothrix gigas]
RLRHPIRLNLENNQLQELPPTLQELTSLKGLYLQGNPLPFLNRILGLQNQPDKVIAAYFQSVPETTTTK